MTLKHFFVLRRVHFSRVQELILTFDERHYILCIAHLDGLGQWARTLTQQESKFFFQNSYFNMSSGGALLHCIIVAVSTNENDDRRKNVSLRSESASIDNGTIRRRADAVLVTQIRGQFLSS